MITRIKLYYSLQKQDRHFAKWLSQNTHLLYRLKTMTPHQVVVLSEYTDEEIETYGIELLYTLTRDLALKPAYLMYLNTKSKKTLADSVLEYQRKELGVAIHNYAYINKIVDPLYD